MPAERDPSALRCRNCGRPRGARAELRLSPPASARSRSPTTSSVVGRLVDRGHDRGPPAGHLALPRAPPGRPRRRSAGSRSARRRSSPPTGSAPTLGIDRLWIKDDTRNPTLSFKDRAVAIAATQALEFGLDALACASTGNLAGATAAAAAAVGLPAYVFVPADLEPAKIDHALAYGATVVPVDGTYDDVNRLCLEVADELGWGFVNVNLRPFYAEGSKTLAFEIAEELGWRLPDVVVAPIASGAHVHQARQGLRRAGRRSGSSSGRRSASSAARRPAARRSRRRSPSGADDIEPVRTPDTIVRSLAIGNPADGRYAVELARATGGSIEAIPDDATADAIRRVAALEGIYPETAGGVTIAAAEAARRRGVIRRRRRGRRAPHRQRPQDARRGPVRARRRSPRRPGPVAGPGPDHPAAVRGLRARGSSHERRPDPAGPAHRRPAARSRSRSPATTVREVIGGLVAAYPGLAPQLLDGDGGLNRFVNVFLNDTDVRHLQALDTPVAERDTVLLLPAMAGGADGTWDAAGVPADRHARRLLLLSGAGCPPLIPGTEGSRQAAGAARDPVPRPAADPRPGSLIARVPTGVLPCPSPSAPRSVSSIPAASASAPGCRRSSWRSGSPSTSRSSPCSSGVALAVSSALGTRWFVFGRPWPTVRRAPLARPAGCARARGRPALRPGARRDVPGPRRRPARARRPAARAGSRSAPSSRSRRLLAVTGFCLGCRLYGLQWWVPDQFDRFVLRRQPGSGADAG